MSDTPSAEHDAAPAVDAGDDSEMQKRHLVYLCAADGDLRALKMAIEAGTDFKSAFSSGMTPLHIAIAMNRLEIVQFLVGIEAPFFPDHFGRWPSIVAAECEVSEELLDYIVEQEAKFIGLT